MSRACSISARRPYGLARVCRVLEIPRSTVYSRREVTEMPRPAARRGPRVGIVADKDLLAAIRSVLAAPTFTGEGYRKVWARLRFRGVRTDRDRVRRMMGRHGLLVPQRGGNPHGPKAHDGSIVTERPNEMWATDMTGTLTVRDGAVGVFIVVDHGPGDCVGIHAAKRATRFEALEPLRQGVREHFGRYDAGVAAGLSLRHDHGSQFMSDHYQQDLAFLGIQSSPAFVREPEGNGCAERFIRTLKEQLLWVRTFGTVDDLNEALQDFRTRYNSQWILERHDYRTPSEAREHMAVATGAAA